MFPCRYNWFDLDSVIFGAAGSRLPVINGGVTDDHLSVNALHTALTQLKSRGIETVSQILLNRSTGLPYESTPLRLPAQWWIRFFELNYHLSLQVSPEKLTTLATTTNSHPRTSTPSTRVTILKTVFRLCIVAVAWNQPGLWDGPQYHRHWCGNPNVNGFNGCAKYHWRTRWKNQKYPTAGVKCELFFIFTVGTYYRGSTVKRIKD